MNQVNQPRTDIPSYCKYLVGGWATPLKNMKVNWDDEIPNISGKIKLMFQTFPNHQPDTIA